MVTIEAKPGAALRLGYTGEHLARRIRFDIGDWHELYGDGVAVLLARRESDDDPYLVPITQDEDTVLWNLRREDVAIAGGGECELQYLVGNVVAKEERWITTVEPSMEEPGEYPESPEQGYLEQVAAEGAAARWAAREARYRADAAENSAKKAEASANQVEETVAETVNDALNQAKESGEFDGAPGHTPVKGTDYWTDEDKAEIVEEVLAEMPEGGGSGPSEVFIDVTELPTENIRDDVIYRLFSFTPLCAASEENIQIVCHIVDGLPSRGETGFVYLRSVGQLPSVVGFTLTLYYNLQDKMLYGYNMQELNCGTDWVLFEGYPCTKLEEFMQLYSDGAVCSFGGIVTEPQAQSTNWYLLKTYTPCFYYEGVWVGFDPVGKHGDGLGAVTFNSSQNTAAGWFATAEGEGTKAVRRGQHVGGRFNVEDKSTTLAPSLQYLNNPNRPGRYAHIIGNGSSDYDRSNAYTLDWEGVGWFAKGVKVGGTGENYDEAVDVLTEADMDTIKEYVVADLPETGGGAGAFVVHGTINYNAGTFFEVEETYEQISAALSEGKQVVVRAVNDESGGIRVFQYTDSDGGQTPGHYFASTNGEETYFSLCVSSDNSWELIKTIFATSGFSGWSDYDKEQMMEHVLGNLPRYDGGYDLA